MGLGASLVTFSPGTLIKSADMNSNFSNLNNISSMTGTATYATNAVNLVQPSQTVGASVNSSGQVTFGAAAPHDSSGNHYAPASASSGSGSGTYNHNYVGTPNFIGPMVNSTNNAEGLGVDSVGSTTWHLNMPTFYSWLAEAMGVV
jgi:hypothetical protein